ncbi:MAG: VOC family protein [Nitrospirales bacterium]|nr:VOC family protein [Nitrospirales bacterium]
MDIGQSHPAGDIRGLRHLALHVTDRAQSQTFYQTMFQMQVVWQPDEYSVYLSSGTDNLALHQISEKDCEQYRARFPQFLDHFGFLVNSPEAVDRLYQFVQAQGAMIVNPPKQHRDGSYSFYLADPDQITIQILFEPTVSMLTLDTSRNASIVPSN